MQTPSVSTRSDVLHDRYGTYHSQRMSAMETLQPLAQQFEESQQSLRLQQDALRQAYRSETAARAVRDLREAELLDEVRGFASQLKLLARRNTEGASYVKYFPNRGVTDVIYLARAKRLNRIEELVFGLRAETNASVLQLGEKLKASYERYRLAATAHEAAIQARREARVREKGERLAWLAAYRNSHAELVKVFSITDPKLADQFFAPVRLRNGDTEEEVDLDDEIDLDEPPADGESGSSNGSPVDPPGESASVSPLVTLAASPPAPPVSPLGQATEGAIP